LVPKSVNTLVLAVRWNVAIAPSAESSTIKKPCLSESPNAIPELPATNVWSISVTT
jgi:hypothetical protein